MIGGITKLNAADFFRRAWAGIAAVFTYVFGGADKWLLGLLVIIIMDYISGIVAAIINREVSSRRGFIGILKKMLIFCIVAVAHIVDSATGAGGVLRALTIGFLMANEGISVLENCGRCGIPLPKRLLEVLEQIRDKDNNSDKK